MQLKLITGILFDLATIYLSLYPSVHVYQRHIQEYSKQHSIIVSSRKQPKSLFTTEKISICIVFYPHNGILYINENVPNTSTYIPTGNSNINFTNIMLPKGTHAVHINSTTGVINLCVRSSVNDLPSLGHGDNVWETGQRVSGVVPWDMLATWPCTFCNNSLSHT